MSVEFRVRYQGPLSKALDDPRLETVRAKAKSHLVQLAEEMRQRVLPAGAGKLAALQATYNAALSPQSRNRSLIAAEAARNGQTVQEATDYILAEGDRIFAAVAQIEDLEQRGLARIDEQPTISLIEHFKEYYDTELRNAAPSP